ncbi:FAD-dependent oxidoreductase [Conexibacter sp. JD483]|uniref:L-aspartate oxidase n=1 Tax=unclassified Conexibacter TaxID=2627773 RepID=UPI0027189259|nr:MULTISPECIES: FAD-dependent oxidoreductase [unclassified Conexibacter]MDO8188070.1 FAD-dependent oxidoreductase [Conexibacter sp. CPCC 205706]MDO8200492.1 FAD-dependent oxidoreductase [Conexibacter sp. CPCC 205762]MDR9369839.1 FAD-dependent oxidoreductase [Conexibacter sp. JD483]
MERPVTIEADLAVVGAGGAGLYTALTAASAGARVALVSATPLAESSSYWAQGGLAAALAIDDSPERHLHDTLVTGRGTVRRSAAEALTNEAPAMVKDLARLGVQFDADRRGRLALGLEGGHSVRRIVHAGGSATGRRVSRQLAALAAEDERILVLEDCAATAVLQVDGRAAGVRLRDGRLVLARAVVLATGGAAALWARSTNPVGSTGSGLLLAQRAGAALADLEMVQFHPTAVAGIDGADSFLVTEAVRGEGALLLDAGGERFVDELLPRDEVSRAVARTMLESGADSVSLDMRAVDPEHFPNVVSVLRRAGLDPARDLIPVAPAAHYMMGGIATDLDGRSSLPALYAVGECACTGLHGANRLASNSLSECFVFGRRAALAALDEPALTALPQAPASTPPPRLTAESRAALWRDAGIERDAAGLRRLLDDPHPIVRLVAASALAREESRGAHQRRDFPTVDTALDGHHTVVTSDGAPSLVFWR